MSLIVITAPSAEPVTLAEARAQARIDSTTDDPTLARYIVAAREMAEHELQRTLVVTTYELMLDAFPDGTLELPMGPIPAASAMSVTSVKYTDAADVEQTVDPSAYTLDGYSNAPRLVPVAGWPTPKDAPNAVRIRYTSGHATPGTVPPAVKQWILAHVAEMNERREAAGSGIEPLPFLSRLLDPYRSFR